MAIKIGNTDISNVLIGSTQVNSIYLGSVLVWSAITQRNDLFAKWIEDRLDSITESDLTGVTNITYGAFSGLTNLTSISFPSTIQSFTIRWDGGTTEDCGISACVPATISVAFGTTGSYYQTYSYVTYKMEGGSRKYVEFINYSRTTITIPASAVGFGKSGRNSYYAPACQCSTFSFGRGFGTSTFGTDGLTNPLRNMSRLRTLTVNSSNTNLKAISNLLYSYDGTILYAIPRAITTRTQTVASGVTTIAYHCASNSNLQSVTIPSTVTKINNYAFSNCSSLTSFTYQGTMANWANVTLNTYWHENSAFTVVHCSDGDVTL